MSKEIKDGILSWRPIEEAPENATCLVGWPSENDIDNLMLDVKIDGIWQTHADNYEHYNMVAMGASDMYGPKENPPYTHFIEIPSLPKNKTE